METQEDEEEKKKMKRYPVHRRAQKSYAEIKRERRHTCFMVIGLLLLTVALTSYCVIFNVGPMNEVACLYKNVKNPTYQEMKEFIRKDTTNLNEYTNSYKCGSFSADVIANAKDEGLQAGFVTIFGDENHAIVAFKTTNAGIYFVEPQSDVIFSEQHMNDMLLSKRYYVVRDNGAIELEMNSYTINWFFGIRS